MIYNTNDISSFKDIFTQFISVITSNIIINPLQRIQLIKQIDNNNNPLQYKKIVTKINKNQRLIGFFKGAILNNVYYISSNIAKISFNNRINIASDYHAINTFINFSVIEFIFYPMNRIRLLSYVDTVTNTRESSMLKYLIKIISNDKINGLYKGYILNSIIKFPEFLILINILSNNSNLFQNIIALNIFKILYYPLNSLLIKYQCDSPMINNKTQYLNYKSLLKENLNKKIYNGVFLYIAKNALSVPIQYFVYNFYYQNYYKLLTYKKEY